ncbi:MAG: peptidylprolyl isomerase [Myxococcales bacterium]|nr:peptidylprolyl isomerase [Myxococcales bacterium]
MRISFLLYVFFSTVPLLHAAKVDPLLQAEEAKNSRHPALLQAQRSPSAKTRLRAAQAYARIQAPHAREALQLLALDKDTNVRVMALFGLGQLGWERAWTRGYHDGIKATLQRALQDTHIQVQRAAIEAIGKYAFVETERWLAPFLRSPHPQLQEESLRALFRTVYLRQRRMAQASKKRAVVALSKDFFAQFAKLSQSPHPAIRRGVSYFFARIKDPRALALLIQLAGDKDKETRVFALMGLRKLGSPKGAAAALAALRSPFLEHRVVAIQALQAMKQVQRLPNALAQDPSAHVRNAWVLAWQKSPKPPLAILQRLWEKDPSQEVRASALSAIAPHRDPDTFMLTLIKILHQPGWILREATVKASRSLGWRRITFLSMALQDADVRVRSAALLALIPLKTTRVFSMLQRALHSEELSERGAAVVLLISRKEPQAQELAWSLYQKSLADKWIELREELAGHFAKQQTPQATKYLRFMYGDTAPSVVKIAQEALKKRGILLFPPSRKRRKPSPHRYASFAQGTLVEIETTRGKMVLECFPQDAPVHVATFLSLVKKGFYNGLSWHRIIPNFVIQGGDPDGTGWGSGDFSLRAEINPHRFTRGTLGMPRSMGWDTGSVQLFLTHISTPHLDGQYTVFGRLRSGFDVLDRIERGDRILRATLLSPRK